MCVFVIFIQVDRNNIYFFDYDNVKYLHLFNTQQNDPIQKFTSPWFLILCNASSKV